MGNRVCHWELYSRDAEATKAFYGALFDWTIQPFDNDYHTINTGDSALGGGIFQLPAGDGPPSMLALYVEVDDMEAYIAKAIGLGAEHLHGPTEIPNVGQYALLKDVDGRVFGLFLRPAG